MGISVKQSSHGQAISLLGQDHSQLCYWYQTDRYSTFEPLAKSEWDGTREVISVYYELRPNWCWSEAEASSRRWTTRMWRGDAADRRGTVHNDPL